MISERLSATPLNTISVSGSATLFLAPPHNLLEQAPKRHPASVSRDTMSDVQEHCESIWPKRPMGAFFFYLRDASVTIKVENPEMDPKQVASEAGCRWVAMSDSEKQPFAEQAAKAKEEYTQAVEEYVADRMKLDAMEDKQIRGEAVVRDRWAELGMPKRPMTAFFLYVGDARPTIKAENPNMAVKDIPAEAGRRWVAMSDSEKQPFAEQAAKAYEEYKKAMKEYEANQPPTKKRARKSKYDLESRTRHLQHVSHSCDDDAEG